ncbi:MAG: hypothetical protein L6Q52_01835 [Rhodocyclaceae bacterium]|nr:hypothetical protein [Rhodocyclaceae bacterium]
MLPFLVAAAVASIAAALALTLSAAASPAAAAHAAFAAGIMPLIFGAMLHFVPVLARARGAGLAMHALPLGMLAAGLIAVAAFLVPEWFVHGIHLAVLAGLTFALAMAAWIVRRARAALGTPHPGLYWYLAAVSCLALALAAAGLLTAWPKQHTALRLLHLHLNTLGFVGLAALGTLAVLLPTAAGRPDPQAAAWLRRMLPWALCGVLLIAGGAAWSKPVAHLGALLLFIPVALLGTAWAARYPGEILRLHGAAPSLALALAGLLSLLSFGVLHAQRRIEGGDAVFGFVLAFLLPLVTGAVSQLLPVWLKPGVQSDWHRVARERLGRFAVLRGLTFVAAGWLVAFGWAPGAWLAAAGLALFVAQALPVAAKR